MKQPHNTFHKQQLLLTYLNVVVSLGDERPSFPLDLARTALEAGEDLPHRR